MRYAFLDCYGRLHLAYQLDPSTGYVNGIYHFEGERRTAPADVKPERWESVEFKGVVRAGNAIVGRFADQAAGAYGGAGCLGQTIELAKLADLLGPRRTPEQVERYLESLTLVVDFVSPRRSAAVESAFRAIAANARRDSLARVASARRDSLERLAAARRDSTARTQRERAAREQAARESQARAEEEARARAAQRAAAATTTGASRDQPRASAAAADRESAAARASRDSANAIARAREADRRYREQLAERRRLEEEEARRRRAAGDSAAAAWQAEAEARQQAQREQAERTGAAVAEAAATGVAMAQELGAMFGAYYLRFDPAPSGSTSYTFEKLEGIAMGLNKRFAYIDAGMVSATYTDSFIQRALEAESVEVPKTSLGFFVQAGLILDLKPSDGFSFGPSLGYAYIDADPSSGQAVSAWGPQLGMTVRIGSFRMRVDMGETQDRPYYGAGAFIRW